MATKDQIKKAILEVAGNPESGIVAQYADRWADAIVGLDAPESDSGQKKADKATGERPTPETRVTKPSETR